jgi:ATP-dependent DNA ligase
MDVQLSNARQDPPDLAVLRPQRFGKANARSIVDPIVEPLWDGTRVIARVGYGGPPTLVDERGDELEDLTDIADALSAACEAGGLVLDGWLTQQATRVAENLAVGESGPSIGDLTAQFFIGSIGRRRRQTDARTREADAGLGPLAFVATDLLAVDDELLLDVPLLERKRVLDSVLDPKLLVRRTVFVRPPVAPWLGTWRSLGFFRVAYKAANSRYVPGGVNPSWATAAIPSR